MAMTAANRSTASLPLQFQRGEAPDVDPTLPAADSGAGFLAKAELVHLGISVGRTCTPWGREPRIQSQMPGGPAPDGSFGEPSGRRLQAISK